MITNAEMTIFNRWPDRKQKKTVYLPHYIENVWFQKDQKISPAEGGFVSGDLYMIRIPDEELEGWIPAETFSERESRPDEWTVQDKDFFIIGKWEGGAVDDLQDIAREFRGVLGIVNSHSENFFGTSPHIRIGGGV